MGFQAEARTPGWSSARPEGEGKEAADSDGHRGLGPLAPGAGGVGAERVPSSRASPGGDASFASWAALAAKWSRPGGPLRLLRRAAGWGPAAPV